MKAIYATLAFAMASVSQAHEMLPTYPRFAPSYVEDVMQVQMRMFNKRRDVEWYEVAVFDADWKPVRPASHSATKPWAKNRRTALAQ